MKELKRTKLSHKEVDSEGNVSLKITSEDAFNNRVRKAQEEGKPDPQIYKKQTFRYIEAESPEEAMQMCGGDPEIFLAHFNSGAVLAQHNGSNDLLTSGDFEPTEDVYDLAPLVSQKPSGRAKLSSTEKAVRDLAKDGIIITPEQLKAALALAGIS